MPFGMGYLPTYVLGMMVDVVILLALKNLLADIQNFGSSLSFCRCLKPTFSKLVFHDANRICYNNYPVLVRLVSMQSRVHILTRIQVTYFIYQHMYMRVQRGQSTVRVPYDLHTLYQCVSARCFRAEKGNFGKQQTCRRSSLQKKGKKKGKKKKKNEEQTNTRSSLRAHFG